MSQGTSYRPTKRGLFWEILLAFAFGAAIFVVLIPLTGGMFAYLIPIFVAMVLFGAVHYFFWGRTSLQTMAQERHETAASPQSAPPDQFDIVLNDKERADLIAILEQALNFSSQSTQALEKERLRGILERLRGFGA